MTRDMARQLVEANENVAAARAAAMAANAHLNALAQAAVAHAAHVAQTQQLVGQGGWAAPARGPRGGGAGDGTAAHLRRSLRGGGGASRHGDVQPPRVQLLANFRAHTFQPKSLADLKGAVFDFACDHLGHVFLDLLLSRGPAEGGAAYEDVVAELVVSAPALALETCGFQSLNALLVAGSAEHRARLCGALRGSFADLSCNAHGTRVVQKVLETCGSVVGRSVLEELGPHLLRLVADSNGNYAVQAAVTQLKEPAGAAVLARLRESLDWSLRDFASHPYGCRVVQRIIEHCGGGAADVLLDQLCEIVEHLACSTFGNFCVLHVATHGAPRHRARLAQKLRADFLTYALHKNASNIVEKCLELCAPEDCVALVECVVAPSVEASPAWLAAATAGAGGAAPPPPLLLLVQGQYGNFVAQKLLGAATQRQRVAIVELLHAYSPFVKVRHLLAKVLRAAV